ncbi:hypothetical protein CYY_007682 [Polysphondylium violaceum]|uniref:Uncharacterized protein n=1 Tax=Polysphondylium violaceum TaxID=133409 RepID=A0A8J4PWW1_9MYCE|nr:hypothetical protein CYY_007682 [Polysphondylium violaceum]
MDYITSDIESLIDKITVSRISNEDKEMLMTKIYHHHHEELYLKYIESELIQMEKDYLYQLKMKETERKLKHFTTSLNAKGFILNKLSDQVDSLHVSMEKERESSSTKAHKVEPISNDMLVNILLNNSKKVVNK